jgi:type IV pilus biogenesis protein CpaD/CtpE
MTKTPVKPLICVLLVASLAGCASTSADPADKSVEVHGLFMAGGGIMRR